MRCVNLQGTLKLYYEIKKVIKKDYHPHMYTD